MENLKLIGKIHAESRENGVLVQTYDYDNLVVNVGKNKVLYFLSQGGSGTIDTIRFGYAPQSYGFTVKDTDTNMKGTTIYSQSINSSFILNDNFSITFNWSLGQFVPNAPNGIVISEMGLFFKDGTMFSHVSLTSGGRSPISKTNNIIIDASTWTIAFKPQ